ncbi:MAG: hypothetical protein IJR64_07135, partial [Bacteroidales bacterium]|nr:hypothetical protein [Bacteroidales bacterium]
MPQQLPSHCVSGSGSSGLIQKKEPRIAPELLTENEIEYWFKPLEGGDWAFCLLNRGTEPVSCNIDWQSLNLTDDEVSGLSTAFDTIVYNIEDLWQSNA